MNYFEDYNNYMKTNESIGMTMFNSYDFKFTDFSFANGVRIFLFEKNNSNVKDFINYMNIKDNIKFSGKVEDITDRITIETLKRTSNDIINECKQFAEDKHFMILYCPFNLSYEQDSLAELGEILKNIH